jgi:hypothetical protein
VNRWSSRRSYLLARYLTSDTEQGRRETPGENDADYLRSKSGDLHEDFLDDLKTTFKHKEIEIVAYELAETAYL